MLAEMLKDLRERRGLPQRKVAAMLDIDTATYCKIERGTMTLKRKHIPILAELWGVEEEVFLKQWLAEKIFVVAKSENEVAKDALLTAYQILDESK